MHSARIAAWRRIADGADGADGVYGVDEHERFHGMYARARDEAYLYRDSRAFTSRILIIHCLTSICSPSTVASTTMNELRADHHAVQMREDINRSDFEDNGQNFLTIKFLFTQQVNGRTQL